MIEYELILKDASTYSLNGSAVTAALKESLSIIDAETSFEHVVVEKSVQDGADAIGDSRIKSSNIEITFDVAYVNDSDYRTRNNALLYALEHAEYLHNVTSSVRTRVRCEGLAETFDEGCYQRSGSVAIKFSRLDPYWEADAATTLSGNLEVGFNTIAVAYAGHVDTPPTVTIVVAAPCSTLSIEAPDTGEGLAIFSTLFGSPGNLTMIIDMGLGTVMIGNASDIAAMDDTTGFFKLGVDTDSVKIYASVAGTYSIAYKARSYR